MSHSSRLTVPFAALLSLATGCGLKGEDLSLEGQAIVKDTNESAATIELAADLSTIPGLVLSNAQMTLSAAVAAQSGIAQLAQPAKCLTVTTENNVVTYTFAGCTGPWGLAKLTGQEVATFSPDGPGQVKVNLHSVGLEVNGIAAEHDAKVVVASKGGTQTIDVQGSFTGTTTAGRKVKHAALLTVVRSADACITLKGTTDTKIGLRRLGLRYEAFRRCVARTTCPTGTIVATGDLSGFRVTLTFDGTEEGLATGKNGGEKSFALSCKPAAQP